VVLGNEGLDADTEFAPSPSYVLADRGLGDLHAELLVEALPDPPGRVALLARCLFVGDEDAVDERAHLGRQLGARSHPGLASRRGGRANGLGHGWTADAPLAGDGPDRQPKS
jgi:hypothetical protein